MASAYGVTPTSLRTAAFGVDIPDGATVDLQLDALIAKAEQRVAVKIPSLAARVESGEVAEATVQGVIEDVVLRVVKNPRSLRTLGLDDFQATIDSSVSTGMLYLSGDEIALLSPPVRTRVGSIGLVIPGWRLPGA